MDMYLTTLFAVEEIKIKNKQSPPRYFSCISGNTHPGESFKLRQFFETSLGCPLPFPLLLGVVGERTARSTSIDLSMSASLGTANIPHVKKQGIPPSWAHFVAGGVGAMMGALATCPLEVVKTRLQARENKEVLAKANENTKFGLRTLRQLQILYQEQGIRSLYRGLAVNLAGVVPARALYFGTYSVVKRNFEQAYHTDKHTVWVGIVKICGLQERDSLKNWLSAVCAGFVTITATNPLWFIKTRMQLQTAGVRNYVNTLDCIIQVYRTEGIRAFFRGMGASYIGISESSLQFMLYEEFKKLVKANKKGKDMNPAETLAASSVAKMIAAIVTYPHEVLRTRMREKGAEKKYTGVINAFRVIARTEGLPGLYGGMMPHLLRVIPNAAIMFLTYETVLKFLTPTY